MLDKFYEVNDFTAFNKQVKHRLEKSMGDEYDILLHTVTKNNGGRSEGIIIRKKDGYFAHNLYLEGLYKKYIKGMPMEDAVKELEKAYYEAFSKKAENTIDLNSYEQIKDNIFYRIVNYERNKEILSEIPYLPFLDLAVTFHCLVQNKNENISSIHITYRHLIMWGINVKTVTEQAMENTPRIFPAKINTLEEVIGEMALETAFPGIQPMYVITNDIGINGAGCLLYKDVIKQLAEIAGGDFYILPSSIHEIIAIKDSGFINKEELASMVKEVNTSQVAEEDYLSDSVYYYCIEEKRIIKSQ
jgi:hypothetical protein